MNETVDTTAHPDAVRHAATISTLIEQRADQYQCAIVQTLLVKGNSGEYRNGVTRVTALRDRPSRTIEPLDYGPVLYQELVLGIQELKSLVRRLATEGVLELGGLEIVMTDPSNLSQASGFRYSEFVTTSHRWLTSEWPANYFNYEQQADKQGLPYDLLSGVDLPLYPRSSHLVSHRFGVDLERSNGLVGSFMLFLPNYQAKLSEITLGIDSMSLEVALGTAQLGEIVGKVFASNGSDVQQADINFISESETIELGFQPTEIDVCLLDSSTGELLDQIQAPGATTRLDDLIGETDPRSLQLLIQQGEGQRLEFKAGIADDGVRRGIAESAVAFANRDGGQILVGIKDDAKVSGCPEPDAEERIERIIVVRTDPPVDIAIKKSVLEDQPVYSITVSESRNKPHALKEGNRFLIRHGASDVPMTRSELDELYAARRGSSPTLPGSSGF